MIDLIAAVMAGGVGAAGAMTASWGNISTTHHIFAAGTTSAVVTFTGGGSRPMTVTHSIAIGGLEYKLDSGAYADCSTGTTIEITTGQTATFRYTCASESEGPITVTVTDDDNATTIDTFTCTFTFTG